MLKSITAMTLVGLGLKDAKAPWALMLVISVAVTGAFHLLTHHHLGAVRAAGDFAVLDVIGCLAYIVGAVIF